MLVSHLLLLGLATWADSVLARAVVLGGVDRIPKRTVSPAPTGTRTPKSSGSSTRSRTSDSSSITKKPTATPSPTTQSVSTLKSWYEFDCNNKAATDISMDPEKRWNSVAANGAWGDAMSYWDKLNAKGSISTPFTEEISYFFKGPEGIQCQDLLGENGCDGTVTCKQFSHPAGYFIIYSFMRLEDRLQNLYDAIGTGEETVTDNVPQLAATFAPVETDHSAKLTLDVISMLFTIFMAPMWNIGLKPLGDGIGAMKDTVNVLMSQSITMIKDDMSVSSQVLAEQNNLTETVGLLTTNWRTSLEQTTKNLFNGSIYSSGTLDNMIMHGHFLADLPLPKAQDVNTFMESSLYSYLIPHAWNLAIEGPVLLDTGIDCDGDKVPSPDDLKDFNEEWLDVKEDVTDYRYCFEKKLYIMAGCHGHALHFDDSNLSGSGSSSFNGFNKPSGIDKLDGKTWGTITVDLIAKSSYNFYANNEYKNGGQAPDPSSTDVLDDIWENGVGAAGVFRIPICGMKEAMINWQTHSDLSGKISEHYPCN